MNGCDVVVCGMAVMPFGRHLDSAPRDWIRRLVPAALMDAGLELRDIDAVVLGCESDHLSLQLSPGALMVDEVGLVPCPVLRVECGGASGAAAVRTAVMHLMSGQHRCVLVLGFEHAASHLSAADVRRLYGLSFDMDLEGMAGVTPVAVYALSARMFETRFGVTRPQMAAVAVKNRAHAFGNPWAHRPTSVTLDEVLAAPMISTPFGLLDCSPLSDGAAAVVLMRLRSAPASGQPRAAIRASVCASDRVRLGDRPDPGWFAGKQAAGRAAYAMADIGPDRIDVAEIYDAFTGTELQGIAAYGLAPPEQVGAAMAAYDFGEAGRLPVNLSGGLLGQGAAPGAVGIVQIATLAQLLTGRYHRLPPRELRYGLADAHGGVATVTIAHILERVE